MDVIERPDAAAIPGRDKWVGAMLRTGDGQIHEVQMGYVGGDSAARTIEATERSDILSSRRMSDAPPRIAGTASGRACD